MDLVTLFVSHSTDRTQICELGPVNCRESATWWKSVDGLPLFDSTSIIKCPPFARAAGCYILLLVCKIYSSGMLHTFSS